MIRIALFLAALCAAGAAALGSATAARAESCTYDAPTKSVTAAITPGAGATLKVTAAGAIAFGSTPSPCDAATTANTDSVSVSGASGSTERLVVDLGEHTFGPGATGEFNIPEIEITAALGDTGDSVVVNGSAATTRSTAAGRSEPAARSSGRS
jgi:hypothetical protein